MMPSPRRTTRSTDSTARCTRQIPSGATRSLAAVRSGSVTVNGLIVDYKMPFGGFKQSGIGREGGVESMENYFLRIGHDAFGFRYAELLADDVYTADQRHHFVQRVPAAHAFSSHAAIGRKNQPLRPECA